MNLSPPSGVRAALVVLVALKSLTCATLFKYRIDRDNVVPHQVSRLIRH